jgi:hypothetical protein
VTRSIEPGSAGLDERRYNPDSMDKASGLAWALVHLVLTPSTSR